MKLWRIRLKRGRSDRDNNENIKRNLIWLASYLLFACVLLFTPGWDTARCVAAVYALTTSLYCVFRSLQWGVSYVRGMQDRPPCALDYCMMTWLLSAFFVNGQAYASRVEGRDVVSASLCLIAGTALLCCCVYRLLAMASLSEATLARRGRARYRAGELGNVSPFIYLIMGTFMLCLLNFDGTAYTMPCQFLLYPVTVSIYFLGASVHMGLFPRCLSTLRYHLRHHPDHPQTRLLLRQMERQRPLYIVAAGLLCAGFALWVWRVFVPAAFY